MRSIKAGMRLETLESRALLTTTVGFIDRFTQDVSDKVGTVDVSIGFLASDPKGSGPVTVTVSTGGGTAVPGVDYTPVQKTFTLTSSSISGPSPTEFAQVAIPILRGPASLGTRTLQVSVSPTPGAPQGQSEFIGIHHETDTTNPTVVQSQALTQAGYVVAFSIQFSKPMAIGPVTNLANYAVAAPAAPVDVPLISTSFSKNISLKSVTYDATNDTAYLVPMTKLKIRYVALYGGFGSSVSGEFQNYYQIESPAVLAAAMQAKQASSGTPPALNQSLSTLTDTSGNPLSTTGGGGLAGEGTLFTQPQLARARPTDLAYIFGARTHAERTRGRS
jgi:hypothetical protein